MSLKPLKDNKKINSYPMTSNLLNFTIKTIFIPTKTSIKIKKPPKTLILLPTFKTISSIPKLPQSSNLKKSKPKTIKSKMNKIKEPSLIWEISQKYSNKN